ncbi:MAG: carbon starvation protein A [Pseudohongiellaceae bacterium]|nr:MAG: carbon starvation protein CstA [Gammaproteobacteria bacterium RIFCSPLOWO2_02_FULL_57_10]
MSSVLIVILGLAGFSFGWFVYSRFIAEKIYKLDPNFVTPAHEVNDGVDFVPTNKFVLWGAHFTSVAGASPIVGPAIAIYWGWVPAVIWVTLGSIFFAGVHDMGAMWASARHRGRSIGALSEDVVGKRTRTLFMIVIFLLLLMVNAVFGSIIAAEMIEFDTAVIPSWVVIPIAIAIGVLIRRNVNLLLISIIGVSILYFSIWVGAEIPLALPETVFGISDDAAWILILFTYAAIASMLPVWLLLQPRDYINGAQLVVGLLLLYGAVLFAMPEVTAPAFNEVREGTPNMFPLLFITVACGALSGFHGIVSSGTTSKQLNKEPDARFVGYLGALGEGSLALITLVVVSSSMYAASPEQWHVLYDQFSKGGASAFITGGGNLLATAWGLPVVFANTLLATMVVLFASTTMDAGVRLQRYIIQEWGQIYNIKALDNNVVATLVAVGSCLALAFGAGGPTGNGGNIIWPLFGATNQILASLTLLVLSIFLIKLGRPARYTLVPMVLVMFVASWGCAVQLMTFFRNEQWLLVVMSIAVLIASIMVILEALAVFSAIKRDGVASLGKQQ